MTKEAILSIENGFIKDPGFSFAASLASAAWRYVDFSKTSPVMAEMNGRTYQELMEDAFSESNVFENVFICLSREGSLQLFQPEVMCVQEFVCENISLVLKINQDLEDDVFVLSGSRSAREEFIDRHFSVRENWMVLSFKLQNEWVQVDEYLSNALGSIGQYLVKLNPVVPCSDSNDYPEDDVELHCYNLPDWISIPQTLLNSIDDFIIRYEGVPNILMFRDEDIESIEKLMNVGVLDCFCANDMDFHSPFFRNKLVQLQFKINHPLSVILDGEEVFNLLIITGKLGDQDEFTLIKDYSFGGDDDDDDFDDEWEPTPGPVLRDFV